MILKLELKRIQFFLSIVTQLNWEIKFNGWLYCINYWKNHSHRYSTQWQFHCTVTSERAKRAARQLLCVCMQQVTSEHVCVRLRMVYCNNRVSLTGSWRKIGISKRLINLRLCGVELYRPRAHTDAICNCIEFFIVVWVCSSSNNSNSTAGQKLN